MMENPTGDEGGGGAMPPPLAVEGKEERPSVGGVGAVVDGGGSGEGAVVTATNAKEDESAKLPPGPETTTTTIPTQPDENNDNGEKNTNDEKKKILYRDVRADTRCSICWGTVKNCVTVRVCLHRFCNDCVQESIRKNQMCCPECRAKVASRRDFVKDPKFDAIVSAIYEAKGGAEAYDEKEEKFSRKEATTILEDNLEKQREERSRYDAIAEQIKREQQERKEQRLERERLRAQREHEQRERILAVERNVRLQQQEQLQRQIAMQQQQRAMAERGIDLDDPHLEHRGKLDKGVNELTDDDDRDEADRYRSQEEYDRRVREVKEKIKREADAKRMAMMACGLKLFNWGGGEKLKPLPPQMNLANKTSDHANDSGNDNEQQEKRKREDGEEEEEEEEEERQAQLKREEERRNFEAFSKEHKMSGRVAYKKVKEQLSFMDLVKAKKFDLELANGTSGSKTVSEKEGGQDKDRGSDEENDVSLANINNRASQGHNPAGTAATSTAPINLRAYVPKKLTISHENGMMHKSAIAKEDFIHISLRRVLGDPLAIAKFDHMLVPKDLTIENLLSSFVVQNYFVSAIVWKDKEGSEEKKKTEQLRVANFKFGEEADEVMCAECGSGHMPEKILLCDGCDAGLHCFCLTPKLDEIPEGDDPWYCDKCERKKPRKDTTVYELFKDEIEKGAYPLVLNYTGRA
jgi:hypothetical protein